MINDSANPFPSIGPSSDKLAGVKVGDTVFVGTYREVLRPVQVEKVGKIHIVADGKKYCIRDGIQAGKMTRASMGYGYTRAHPYTEALRDAWELERLKKQFESELVAFRNKPGRQTIETLKSAIKGINPEAEI